MSSVVASLDLNLAAFSLESHFEFYGHTWQASFYRGIGTGSSRNNCQRALDTLLPGLTNAGVPVADGIRFKPQKARGSAREDNVCWVASGIVASSFLITP